MLFRLVSVGALLALLLAATCGAQTMTGVGKLEIPDPAPVVVPVAGTADVVLAWTFTFNSAQEASAATASGGAKLVWAAPACEDSGITLAGALTQTFASEPQAIAQTKYDGVSTFTATAAPGTRGETAFRCAMQAHVEDMEGLASSANRFFDALVQVAYDGTIEATRLDPVELTAGPQKQIPFLIRLENKGNSLSQVTFEVVAGSEGRWMAIAPAPVILEPAGADGAIRNVVFVAGTPFQNGYNSEGESFTLRIQSQSTKNPAEAVPPVELTFDAKVRGWYVPGADPWLPLMLVLSAVAAVRMRRAS